MNRNYFIFSFFVLSTVVFGQSKDCLKYEPNVVQLIGVVSQDTMPLTLNWKTDATGGDNFELECIIHLSSPVCVNGEPNDSINVSENNIGEMQLFLTLTQMRECHKYIGKKVTVTGTLFHGFSEHHYTSVIVRVKEWLLPNQQLKLTK
jgi:hypothetical protein